MHFELRVMRAYYSVKQNPVYERLSMGLSMREEPRPAVNCLPVDKLVERSTALLSILKPNLIGRML